MNQRQKNKYEKSPETLMMTILSLKQKLEDNEDGTYTLYVRKVED